MTSYSDRINIDNFFLRQIMWVKGNESSSNFRNKFYFDKIVVFKPQKAYHSIVNNDH